MNSLKVINNNIAKEIQKNKENPIKSNITTQELNKSIKGADGSESYISNMSNILSYTLAVAGSLTSLSAFLTLTSIATYLVLSSKLGSLVTAVITGHAAQIIAITLNTGAAAPITGAAAAMVTVSEVMFAITAVLIVVTTLVLVGYIVSKHLG